MKTKLHTITLSTLLALIISTPIFALDFHMPEEKYIDDIPFNTEQVFDEIMSPAFELEEEAYINDIPFETALIVDFEMEEENEINDIPFPTNYIAQHHLATTTNFHMEEENYIDDIPFSTEKMADDYQKQQQKRLLCAAR